MLRLLPGATKNACGRVSVRACWLNSSVPKTKKWVAKSQCESMFERARTGVSEQCRPRVAGLYV